MSWFKHAYRWVFPDYKSYASCWRATGDEATHDATGATPAWRPRWRYGASLHLLCCCNCCRLKGRSSTAAVSLHLAQVLFQAIGPAHAAADVYSGGCCGANRLCRGEGSRHVGASHTAVNTAPPLLSGSSKYSRHLQHPQACAQPSTQSPSQPDCKRRTCYAVGGEPPRQQPAVAAVCRKARCLHPQLAPVKGLAAAALQAVHDQPVGLPAQGSSKGKVVVQMGGSWEWKQALSGGDELCAHSGSLTWRTQH